MIIDIRKYSFSIGNLKVDDFDLITGPSEIVGIVGPSGSGKTTLLRSIISRSPIYGSAENFKVPSDKEPIGYVSQDDTLFKWKSVQENMMAFCPQDSQAENKRQRLQDALEIPEGYGSRNVESLSGGEKRRVAIIRALLATGRLNIFDEALVGLDFKIRTQASSVIVEEAIANRSAALCVSHDPLVLFSMCTSAVTLPRGGGSTFERFDFCHDLRYRDPLEQGDLLGRFMEWFRNVQE